MNLLQALAQALRIPELRRKLLFTLGLLLAFRVLASISIPGANAQALNDLFSRQLAARPAQPLQWRRAAALHASSRWG